VNPNLFGSFFPAYAARIRVNLLTYGRKQICPPLLQRATTQKVLNPKKAWVFEKKP